MRQITSILSRIVIIINLDVTYHIVTITLNNKLIYLKGSDIKNTTLVDWMHVDEVANAIIFLIDYQARDKCEIYNLVGSTDYYADPNCENQCDLLSSCLSLDGWPIEGETPNAGIIFDIDMSNIISLSYEFLGIVQSKTINAPIPGFGGIEIKKAIISQTTSADTNKLSLDIKNK